MELLGGDAHLTAQAELPSVGKAGRGVPVDGSGVHLRQKLSGRPPVSGEYHFSASQTGGSSADGAPKPGFFQRRKANQGAKPPKPPRSKKKNSPISTSGVVAIALACALVGGGVGGGIAYFAGNSSGGGTNIAVSDRSSSGGADVTATKVKAGDTMTSSQVYAKYGDCVVSVNVKTSEGEGAGTGFLISEDGYILTNYHVIENSSSVQVTTYDNTSYSASIVGYDESNDIAVLKIDATGLTPVVLGSSDDLYVGDEVMAIGNPLGELTFSLTVGYVSALDREVTLSSGTTMDLIQTDAAINSGNSGGALFNSYGEVVGITNAKYSSSSSSGSASIDNIGFAIPINHVKNIITSIIEKGYIVKPYIGVSVTTVSSEMVSYGLPQGAAVKAVSENSPAAECGLKINDIITAINGEEITTSSELVKIVSASQPGDEMTLTVYRQGESEQLTLTLTVGEQQKSALADPTSSSNQQQSSGSYGGFPFGFGYGYGG